MHQMNRDDDVKFAAEKKPKSTKQVLNFAPKHIILSLSLSRSCLKWTPNATLEMDK